MMSRNAEQVLTDVVVTNPKNVIVISMTEEGGVGVAWSDMSMEQLCYLKQVFDMAVHGRITSAFNPPQQLPVGEKIPAKIQKSDKKLKLEATKSN